MEWIITAALALGALALVAVFVMRTKRHDGGTVRGWFEFDRYKEGEVNRRGMLNRAKWGR